MTFQDWVVNQITSLRDSLLKLVNESKSIPELEEKQEVTQSDYIAVYDGQEKTTKKYQISTFNPINSEYQKRNEIDQPNGYVGLNQDSKINPNFVPSYTLSEIIGNKLSLLKDGEVVKEIDLSLYLDDTNLSRLVSGTVDANGLATFKRDDNSTFIVDFSSLVIDVAKDSERLGGELPSVYKKGFSFKDDSFNTVEAARENHQLLLKGADILGNNIVIDTRNRTYGTAYNFTPKQVSHRVTSPGPLKISVPTVQMTTVTLELDVSCCYQGGSKFSFNMVLNFRTSMASNTNIIQHEDVRIIASKKEFDLNIRYEGGDSLAIYIGELDSDFRYGNISITNLIGTLNGGASQAVFKQIKEDFKVSSETSFGNAGAPIKGNLVQGKSDPLIIKDDLGSEVFETTDSISFSGDFELDEIEKKVRLKKRFLNLSKAKRWTKVELNNGKVDLLDETFVVNDIVRNLGFLDFGVDFTFIIPEGADINGNFYFSVACDLKRHPTVGYDLLKFEILNFDNSKATYLQNLFVTHRLGLTDMNGFKYATKIITIDCSKPFNDSYSERFDIPKTYFDYPLNDRVNTIDNNKLRLRFQQSPFDIEVKTFIIKV